MKLVASREVAKARRKSKTEAIMPVKSGLRFSFAASREGIGRASRMVGLIPVYLMRNRQTIAIASIRIPNTIYFLSARPWDILCKRTVSVWRGSKGAGKLLPIK